MAALLRPFRERRTYRELLFLFSGGPLSAAWFGLLLGGWLLTAILAVTPLLVPVLIGFRAATRLAARSEAEVARKLLHADARIGREERLRAGYWGLLRGALGDARFWKQQVYLAVRTVAGFGTAVATAAVLGSAVWLLVTPAVYRWSDQHFGSWHVDTLPRALLLVPAGAVAMVLFVQLVHPVAAVWSRLATALLDEPGADDRQVLRPASGGRALWIHASLFATLNLALIAIWALTNRGYFWPEWTLMALGTVLAVHAWVVGVIEGRPDRRIAGSTGLTIYAGAAASLLCFQVGIWAVTTRGYFWPAWPALGLALVAVVWAASAYAMNKDRAGLTERIDTLTASRAGAVDVSETSLQRIERNLHDGAQARLVSLGINLGMVEQKLDADPDAARRLVAEARVGIGEALKELRDLARGIRPPILADRGLEAAVAGLAAASPLRVDVLASVETRPAVPVETAAYFVVAEALANASKHAGAHRVTIRIVREAERLIVDVADDGKGGADPAGAGLTGLRQRVEALDGTLTVASPPGGPTTIEAVLPCAS